VDMSPCWYHLKENTTSKLEFIEPVQFISKYLSDRLSWNKSKMEILVHVPCTSKRAGISKSFIEVAKKCANVVHETPIPCCGMGGDRGLYYPELTSSSISTAHMTNNPKYENCSEGFSASRTCEIAMSQNTGVLYQSLFHLVDESTSPKVTEATAK